MSILRPTHRRAFFIIVSLACAIAANLNMAAHGAHADDPKTAFRIVDPDENAKPDATTKPRPRKYDTFAHRVLDIDSGEAPASPEKYALLDALIDDAKQRITYDPAVQDPRERLNQAERILRQIDDILTDHNFLYPPGGYDVTSLRASLAPQRYDKAALERILRVGVNKRRVEHARAHADELFYITDCDISSFLFIGIGDALGIDLHLVDLPDHMFVRWELAGGAHVNWDTNDGAVISDKEYAADYAMGKRLRKRRVYLSSMTDREAEGFAYFLRGQRFEDRNEPAKAIPDLETARKLYPQSTQARSELAWLYATAAGVDPAQRKESLSLAQSALDLEPQCAMFWDSSAAAHAANGDFNRAAKEAAKAEDLAGTPEDRAQFRDHRKSFEGGAMPTTPHPH
ncbi:MAG: hypothetical protein JWN40_4844 [Phycisphaerales bacterium]|nr:hypothetical protein [Phycisphaerales bacterium]